MGAAAGPTAERKSKISRELAVGLELSSTESSFPVQTREDQRNLFCPFGKGTLPEGRRMARMTASRSNKDQRSISCLSRLDFAALQRGSLQQCQTIDSRGSSCLIFPAWRRLRGPKFSKPGGF